MSISCTQLLFWIQIYFITSGKCCLREKPNIKDMGTPVSGKDATVVFPVNPVIRDVLHNGIGFLFIDEPNDLWINSSGLFLNI